MIDVDCMVRSLGLGWLQRVFNDSSATWKRYFLYLSEHVEVVEGIFFLSCNFDVEDFDLSSPFYYEPSAAMVGISRYLCWKKDYQNIIWNNKEIKIDNKPSISKIIIARQESRTRMIFFLTKI